MPGAGGGQPASRRALRELVVGVQRRVLPLAATELEVELFESVLELVVEELLGLEPPLELLFDRPGAGSGAEDGSGDDEEAGAGAGPPHGVLFAAFGESLVDLGAAELDEEAAEFCQVLATKLEAYVASLAFDVVEDGCCSLCEREMPLSRHHLRPRKLHRELKKQQGFSKRELDRTVPLCLPCHKAIHRYIDERTMAYEFYTVEKLLEHEQVHAFVRWASKQKVRVGKATQQEAARKNRTLRYKA